MGPIVDNPPRLGAEAKHGTFSVAERNEGGEYQAKLRTPSAGR